MQDKALIHKTKAVMECSNRNVNVMKRPAYSPDLNPIRNVCLQTQQKVYERMRIGVRIGNEDF